MSEAHITKQQHMAERLFEGLPALAKGYMCNPTIQIVHLYKLTHLIIQNKVRLKNSL
jgi:hypothetical protein